MATNVQWRKKLRYLQARTLKVKGIKRFVLDKSNCPGVQDCNCINELGLDYLGIKYPKTHSDYIVPYQAITSLTGTKRITLPFPVDKQTLRKLFGMWKKKGWTLDFITRDSRRYAGRTIYSIDAKGFVLVKKTPKAVYTKIPWNNLAAAVYIYD